MKRIASVVALGCMLGVGVGVAGLASARAAPASKSELRATSYRATGAIKSFGPGRAFVNIAHDDIPGFMKAMTMSFHPGSADQLAKLQVDDRVRFEFTVTDEGRRVLAWIEKQ